MNYFKKLKVILCWRVFPFLVLLLLGSCAEQELMDHPDCLINYFYDGEYSYLFDYDNQHNLSKVRMELNDIEAEIRYSYFSDRIVLNYGVKEKGGNNVELLDGQRVVWTNELGFPVLIEEEGLTITGYARYYLRFEYNSDKLKYMIADYGYYGDNNSKDSIVVTMFDSNSKNISKLKSYYWFSQENKWMEGGTLNLTYSNNINPFNKLYYVSLTESSTSTILSFFNENTESAFTLLNPDGSVFSNVVYSDEVNSKGYPLSSTQYYLDPNLNDTPIQIAHSEYKYECN